MAEFSRRIFLVAGGAAAGGLVLGFAGLAVSRRAPDALTDRQGALNAWVALTPDGIVTIRVNASEMGQGAQTGLAQIVADEMDADWARVRVEMAPVIAAYMIKDGGYYTGGSSSIRPQFEMFARAGATARAMLIAAAAKRWGVSEKSCTAKTGIVAHGPSGRTLRFGELARDAAGLAVPDTVSLKPRDARTLIGKPVPRLDIPAKVDGRALYGIDVKLDGMLIATLAQCPMLGGTLIAVDETPALAVKGVHQVVKLDDAVSVVARNFWAAKKGLNALAPQWSPPANMIASDAAMFAELRAQVGAEGSQIVAPRSVDKPALKARVDAALAAASRVIEAEYTGPLLAHAAMEPMNATAHVTQAACELWAPMQAQSDMRRDVGAALGIAESAVTLHTTLLGGGFGRRLETDYGVQAARVAKAVGRPVKLIWTREEDMTHDFYRPACAARLRAAQGADGMITAIAVQSASTNDRIFGGLVRSDYAIGDIAVVCNNVASQARRGAWRSVDASISIFFLESLIDEAAHAHGIDPCDYRRRLLKNSPRGLRVLEAAAEMANWGRQAAGRHQGIAYFGAPDWGTAVCEIVELSVDAKNRITLHKVFCAIDPGTAINPGAVAAQAQGGITMGLSAALGEAITLKNGRVEQTNFDSYKILPLSAAPEIEVRVLGTADAAIGGVGEPPVPPAAPALVNAVFAASGQRIRTLPLSRHGFSIR